MLAFGTNRDKLIFAVAIYLEPKYQEGFVLGRQGYQSRKGAPIHFGKIAVAFLFLGVILARAIRRLGPILPRADDR
jgi:hypothetical protein